MLTLNDCLRANRPLIFCSCENDVELLNYLHQNHKNHFQVYSTTFAKFIGLDVLIEKKFQDPGGKTLLFTEVLDSVYNRTFQKVNNIFDTFIFLDVELDRQAIRKVKDILAKYQSNVEYTVNMLFISQTIMVPPELERFSEVVHHGLPNETALKDKSDELCGSEALDLTGDKAPTEEVLNNLKGLTLFEVEQAYCQSKKLYGGIDLKFIREFKKSSLAKTDLLSLLESDVSFDDIGGLSTLKNWVKKSYGGWTVEGKKFGLPVLRGLLLVGLPGTGKSLLMKAIGNEWNLPVINFDPSRLFSSRVGESEANMRRILKIVEGVSPCILAIDEIEKGLAGIQSSTFSDSGVTARVIGSFLTWMEDNKAPIFIIATSNNIQFLPPEMIQRFDETFFVNIPQDFERAEIFRIHIKKLKRNADDFDLKKLSENSVDLSGREIEQTLKESMYESFYSKKELSTEIILNVLSKKTNILTTMSEQLQFLLKWVGFDEKTNDGLRARFASPPSTIDMNRIQSAIEDLLKDVDNNKPFE